MLSNELKTQIRSLWDAFWSGGIANPLTAIEQITYLIFLKRIETMDDEEALKAKREKRDYISLFYGDDSKGIPKHTFRWSYIKGMAPEQRLHYMHNVFNWLKEEYYEQNAEQVSRFRDAVFLIPHPRLLQTAITLIDQLFVPAQNYDTLGDIYEYLLSEIAESGKNGQFRTPRHIIRTMIDIVDPAFGERICDPACGTGGFLVNAYLHILKEHTDDAVLEFEADGTPIFVNGNYLSTEQHEALRSNHFYGYDFDRTMVRLSWMNMIQHGMQNPQMKYSDTLGSRFNEQISRREVGNFDVVLANPPFTGNIDVSDIGESLRILNTTKTELLFVELTLQLLNDGGRAAVIVPEGLLFGSTRAHVNLRKRLIEENRIDAVISLPSGVFQPYTGVKTSILIFSKGGTTDDVWFYEVQQDGYTLDAKRERRPEQNDLWDAVLQYRLRRGEERPSFMNQMDWQLWQQVANEKREKYYLSPIIEVKTLAVHGENVETPMLREFSVAQAAFSRSWSAAVRDIIDNDYNLSAGRYKPFTFDDVEYDPPGPIIRELLEIESDIQAGLTYLLRLVEAEE